MRIIYLHQYFTTPEMSGGTRSYEMARRLVQRGHEVDLVTSDHSGRARRWFETEEAGIRVHWAPVRYSNYMGFSRRMVAFLRFAILAANRAAELPGDVVFATSTPLTICLPAVHAARRRSIPMVFEVRDLWPEAPIAVGALKSRPLIAGARWLERFAYRNSRRIVALADRLKAGVVAAGYPEEHVTVIPNGCDLELFRGAQRAGRDFRRRHAWLQDRPLVVYTGTLGKVNGVEYLARLAAAAWRRDPEIRFLVVGRGCEEQNVRAAAEQLGVLNRNFFMKRPVPKSQMPGILAAADLATNTTVIDDRRLSGDSANKVLDALAADCPVAINHRGAMAGMIEETGCGLVLSPQDLESSAAQVISAVTNPLWLTRARSAARRVAEERFNRDHMAAALESVLMEATSGEIRRRRAA